MIGFSLGSNRICGVVQNRLIVDGQLGGNGELGAIAMLLVILVHDKAHQIVNPLTHIVREREEVVVSSLRSRASSASVGCPKMGSNTPSSSANSHWTSSGFTAGRYRVASAAKQRLSHRDRVYHKYIHSNLTSITKSNICW